MELNKETKIFNDVDLEEVNKKLTTLSPTINRNDDNQIYIDIEDISIDKNISNETDIDEEDLYNDNIDNIIDIPISEQIEDNKNNIDINPNNEILEVVIFEELDNMLKTNYNELEELKLEIDILNDKEEDIILKEEITDLEKELRDLIEKFKDLTKKYEDIYENIDYKDIRRINDEYLQYLINGYDSFLNNDILKNVISKELLEEYVNIVNSIIEIDSKLESLEEKTDNKKEELNISNQELEKMKDEYTNIDKIVDNIKDVNKDFDKSLDNIKELLKNSVKIEKNIEYQKKLSLNINNAIKGTVFLATSKLFPPTRKGNLFRMAFIIMGVSSLANLVKEEKFEKVTYKYDIKNYEKDIKNNMLNIDNTINDIENAFLDIDYIRKTIKNDFKDYIDKIPEYKDLLKNINNLEKALNIEKDIAKNYSNEFKKSLQENNEKIKRLDKYE